MLANAHKDEELRLSDIENRSSGSRRSSIDSNSDSSRPSSRSSDYSQSSERLEEVSMHYSYLDDFLLNISWI